MNNITNHWKLHLPRWPFVIAVLILLTTGIAKWQSTFMPAVAQTPQATSSPNARDYFDSAESILTGTNSTIWRIGLDSNNAYTLAEKDEAVQQNLPAFAKLEEGLKYPYRDRWEGTTLDHYQYQIPEYIRADPALVRAVCVAGDVREAHGDWAGATTYYLDGMNVGADLPHGANLIRTRVGIACESMSRKKIYLAISHLNAVQSEAALKRLEVIENLDTTPEQTVRGEEEFTQAGLFNVFSQKDWRKQMILLADEYAAENRNDAVEQIELRLESAQTFYSGYTRLMDRVAAIAKLPWPEQIKTPEPTVPADAFTRLVFYYPCMDRGCIQGETTIIPGENYPYMDTGCILKQECSLALNRMLEIQLALQAYDQDHGHYPADLDELAPTYLSQHLVDPFSENQPFHYKLQGDKYVLYSVGPDTVDNGGTPIYNNTWPTSFQYAVDNILQKGDVVAGVNNETEFKDT